MKRFILCFSLTLMVNASIAQSANDALLQQIASREKPGNSLDKEIANISPFFEEHVILFFFSSTCPHCHQQAPILKRWAMLHHAKIEALSFDDKPLPDFQKPHVANTELVDTAFQGNTIRYPALFVMNTRTQAIYPAAIGELNAGELEARMQVLIQKIIHYEQGISS